MYHYAHKSNLSSYIPSHILIPDLLKNSPSDPTFRSQSHNKGKLYLEISLQNHNPISGLKAANLRNSTYLKLQINIIKKAYFNKLY